jgi:hypothetical protein
VEPEVTALFPFVWEGKYRPSEHARTAHYYKHNGVDRRSLCWVRGVFGGACSEDAIDAFGQRVCCALFGDAEPARDRGTVAFGLSQEPEQVVA